MVSLERHQAQHLLILLWDQEEKEEEEEEEEEHGDLVLLDLPGFPPSCTTCSPCT